MVDVNSWGAPQFVLAGFYALVFLASYTLHGRPKPDLVWNGWSVAFQALLFIIVLGWGGFWS